jgi:hypothetical protein
MSTLDWRLSVVIARMMPSNAVIRERLVSGEGERPFRPIMHSRRLCEVATLVADQPPMSSGRRAT